jgi:hypothetical protein
LPANYKLENMIMERNKHRIFARVITVKKCSTMQAYKFDTKISADGMISIPVESGLCDQKVEVILIPHVQERERRKKRSLEGEATPFVDKWAGAFSLVDDPDDDKYNRLKERYDLK